MKTLEFQKVDKNKVIPLYYQVSQILEEIIRKGEIKPGERLPSEEVLADEFEVSRPTINKAISLLVRKSLLSQERGKGTFVRGEEVKLTLMQELASFGEAFKRQNIRFHTEVLALRKEEANKDIADRLEKKEGDIVVYLQRLRYVEKEPILLSESYLPYDFFPGLENEDFTKNSLYSLLEKRYNVPVMKTERYVRAVKALDEEAHFFRIPIGEPVIQLEGVAFSTKNLKVEYFNTRLRGDKAVLCTTLYRKREGKLKEESIELPKRHTG